MSTSCKQENRRARPSQKEQDEVNEWPLSARLEEYGTEVPFHELEVGELYFATRVGQIPVLCLFNKGFDFLTNYTLYKRFEVFDDGTTLPFHINKDIDIRLLTKDGTTVPFPTK